MNTFKVGDRVIRKSGKNIEQGTVMRVGGKNLYYIRWDRAATGYNPISGWISGTAIVLATEDAVSARQAKAQARHAAYQAERARQGGYCPRCHKWHAWEHHNADGTCRYCQDKPLCPYCERVNYRENMITVEDRVAGTSYLVCRTCDEASRRDAAGVAATDRAWADECNGRNLGPRGFTLSRGR